MLAKFSDNLDEQTTLQITELCGHYTYSKPKVALEINKLYENLASIKIDGKRFVIETKLQFLMELVILLIVLLLDLFK